LVSFTLGASSTSGIFEAQFERGNFEIRTRYRKKTEALFRGKKRKYNGHRLSLSSVGCESDHIAQETAPMVLRMIFEMVVN